MGSNMQDGQSEDLSVFVTVPLKPSREVQLPERPGFQVVVDIVALNLPLVLSSWLIGTLLLVVILPSKLTSQRSHTKGVAHLINDFMLCNVLDAPSGLDGYRRLMTTGNKDVQSFQHF